MLDKYYKYKLKFRNYIIFIKSGIFYECMSIDALIINKLFNYKLKRISNTFKVGFPTNNINKVIDRLKENNINYIIVNDDKIKDKYESEFNNYRNYNFDIDNILYNFLRIERIIKYLNDNIVNDEINEKLQKIYSILDEK